LIDGYKISLIVLIDRSSPSSKTNKTASANDMNDMMPMLLPPRLEYDVGYGLVNNIALTFYVPDSNRHG
jgi:hypothetical protein